MEQLKKIEGYTPGPWEVSKYKTMQGIPFIEQKGTGFFLSSRSEASEANASLIAYAPELYELACKQEERIRVEAIAFNSWVGSLNKEGFPKNENGSIMDCWQLYDYFCKSEKRDIYIHHAKTFDSTQLLTNTERK